MHGWKRALAGMMASLLILQCAPYATLADELDTTAPTAQSESTETPDLAAEQTDAAVPEPAETPAPTGTPAPAPEQPEPVVPESTEIPAPTETPAPVPSEVPAETDTAVPEEQQPTATPAVGESTDSAAQDSASSTEQAGAATLSETVKLQSGKAIIPANADETTVKQLLFDALVGNKDGINPQELNWEYYCTGKNGPLTNDAWGSVDGFTSEKKVVFVPTTFTHPALASNVDGDYQVRLAGTDVEVTLTKAQKEASALTLNENVSLALPYNEDGTINFDTLRQNLFTALVASSTPELTVEDVEITYYGEATSGSLGDLGHDWVPLEGGSSGGLKYPAISTGSHNIKISYNGNETYSAVSASAIVTLTERSEAPYTLNDAPDAVTLTVDENLNVDYTAVREAVFNAVVASSDVLTADNVTITYYGEATSGSLGNLGHAWVPLEGGTSGGLKYPGIPAGTQQVRISWPGNQQYAPTTIDATVEVADREQLQFNLNGGSYEVGMVFDDALGYDYSATATAIYNAVVASTSPVALSADDVTVEYNVDKTGITDSFKPLDQSDATGLIKFGTGTWEIRISWDGNQEYRGNSVTVNVTTTDARIASTVALKSGVSFTYNMDPTVMEQAIFDNVIDWENSTLPARETLSPDNFVIEYKAKLTDIESGVDLGLGDVSDWVSSDLITQWVPLEGKVYEIGGTVLGAYPVIGAGEAQSIRISYKGNADYRPSDNTEGTVTVNKAKVSVSVNSTNIYADESLPANFITTNPADKFDVYTIYAGTTSNVTTALYLDLPDRYTSSVFLKALDPVVEAIYGKSFTQMMNDGITLGELRQLFSTQEILDLLDKLNIDTGTFGQILTVINKLPSVTDSLRISFGTPNRAGLYTVGVVTDSQNYETGVGMGFLLVKMRLSGTKLTWNQEINGKLTAEQAKNFDFGATLSYNGDVTISQSGVHYLYSGFTSKWRIYSSTTTPPTEPGSYVVTVCILGGNHFAAPITRTFTITK